MPDQTTGAAEDTGTTGAETARSDQTESTGPQGWAGAMAQIDAEIAELQQMLASRRAAAQEADGVDVTTGADLTGSTDVTGGAEEPDAIA